MAFVVDIASKKIILANQRACAVLEYTSDQMTQLSLKDIHPYDMPAVIDFSQQVEHDNGAITHKLSYRTKSGKFLPAGVSGRILKENGTNYLIATVRTDSERALNEKDLQSKHEDLESLIQIRTAELADQNRKLLNEITDRDESTQQAISLACFPEENPNPVFRVSEEGKIIYANSASSYILEKWETGVGKILPEAFSKNVSCALELRKPLEVEFKVSDQFYSFVISKVQSKNYANVYAKNITEKKKYEQALLKTKDEAEKANQAKSGFLAKMSHELRTPLNAILGFSQILQINSDNNLNPTQIENLNHIFNAGNHLLDLINEVLDLAKVESGNLTLNIEPTNVANVIEEMRGIFQPIAENFGVHLSLMIDTTMELVVRADKTRLKQVIFNLVSNAIKYNNKGGSVTLACKPLSKEKIQIDVIDTGPGIAPDDQGKLFDPFDRLGKDYSEVEGTGIGLTVTKELVELMEGSIGLRSQPGEGSHFYFELPVAKNP